LAVYPVEVFDRHAGDVFGRPQEETLQMRVLAFVLYDIVSDELLDDPETGGLEILWFADEDAHGNIVHPAAEVPEGAVLLVRVVSVDDVVSLVEGVK